jgi:ABC-2 type transport system ATP-binding protein
MQKCNNDVLLQVSGLKKAYGSKLAVNNLNLTVSGGEIVGLLGHNGAGKTTTIECILGARKRDSGQINILGYTPEKNHKKLFEQIGVQMQENHYQDKIKVKEICETTSVLYSKTLDYIELLKEFSLTEKLNSYVSDLSGGQRQKLSVLLALLPDPKLVFLDELTTGLDPKARREIWRYLEAQKQLGKGILLTSHNMDEVEYLCDRIIILKNGETIVSGTPAQVIELSCSKNLEDAYLFYTGEEVA